MLTFNTLKPPPKLGKIPNAMSATSDKKIDFTNKLTEISKKYILKNSISHK